jgi:hypothetical protein
LSVGTAWLYAQFATGKLANYDYVDSSSRYLDAGLLQEAIWTLQNNQTWGSYPAGTGNTFYNEALSALGGYNNAIAPATSSDNYDVDVLNLYLGQTPTAADSDQNQLVYTGGITPPTPNGPFTPIPDSGAPLALLALSLAGLAVFARRMEPSAQFLRK